VSRLFAFCLQSVIVGISWSQAKPRVDFAFLFFDF
jgi:hypothetical protein